MLTRHVIKVVETAPWVTLTYWSDGMIEETRSCPPPAMGRQVLPAAEKAVPSALTGVDANEQRGAAGLQRFPWGIPTTEKNSDFPA